MIPDWLDCWLAALNIEWRQNDFSVTHVVLLWLKSFQLPIGSRRRASPRAMQMRRVVTLKICSAKFADPNNKNAGHDRRHAAKSINRAFG